MCLCIQQTLSALIKTYLPQVTHPLISTCETIYFFLFSLFQYPLSAFFCVFFFSSFFVGATLSEIHKPQAPLKVTVLCENGCYGNAALEECEKLFFLNYPSFSSSSSFQTQKLPPERQQGCVQQRCFSISFTIFFHTHRHTHIPTPQPPSNLTPL